MDELIVRVLRGEATDIEARRLVQWRAAAPENELEFQEIAHLWQRTDQLAASPAGAPPSAGDIARVGDARRKRTQARAGRRAILRSPWLGRAAAVAALGALLYVALGPDGHRYAAQVALTPTESSLGPHRVMTMTLTDGSVVRAAPETHLEFPPSTERREVVLEGRAFFAVAHHELPFEVRTRAGAVTAVGTRFEISTDSDGMRVVVVEGAVRVSNDNGSAEVKAGQVAFVSAGSTARIMDRADVWALLDWSGGLLVFQSTPLRQVAEELERHFGRSVRITDADMEGRRVTAWFEDESVDEVVSAVCIVVDARCSVTEAEVTIGR